MKRNVWVLMTLALLLILCASIGTSLSYFTTYVTAAGGKTIQVGEKTEIHENPFVDRTKHVVITASEDSEPIYVRAKAFGGEYPLTYSSLDGSWTQGEDGFWYYGPILYAGESTSELLIMISHMDADAAVGETFNVVVVYEQTPVRYHEDGTPYADWSVPLEGGN